MLVGRQAELEGIRGFVSDSEQEAVALVLEGEAGIGKTALWGAAVSEARDVLTVVTSRPARAEATYAFAALSDLLPSRLGDLLAAVPPPQLRALEVALLLREAPDQPPAINVVAAGFYSAIRALAAGEGVLLAIDDVQWLDAASAEVLAYALRRVAPGDGVRFLFSRRVGDGPAADPTATMLPERIRRIALGPLSLGATQRLLLTRLGWLPPRRIAHRIHLTAGGNPFYALELAAALLRHGGRLDESGELPVPESLDALIGADIAQLPDGARRALLATALLTDPQSELVVRATGDDGDAAVDDAVRAGMLVRDGSRLRLAHPLYGSVAESRAPLQERREAHLRLAELVSGTEERARHRALGSVAPDARVAGELEAAALAATARGAAGVAAELATAAWRFTDPSDGAMRTRRLLDAAERHSHAGSVGQPEEMLRHALPDLPPGPERARALVLLAMRQQPPEVLTLLDEALVCADRPTRAAILAEKAFLSAAGQVDDIEQAHAWAVEAVGLAEGENEELQAVCTTTLGWMEMMRGRPIAWITLHPAGPPVAVYDHPDRLHAVRAMWRGETARAGELLHALLAEAERREEESSRLIMTGHLVELALRVGDFRRAAELVDAMRLSALPLRDNPAAERRFRAFLAAAAGDREHAQAELDALTALGPKVPRWQVIEAQRARGFADLITGEVGEAAATLAAVAETVAAAGIGDPGAFPVAVDLIEARIAVGDRAGAAALLAELEDRCRAQDHPWGLAGVVRGRGLLLAAAGDDAGAETALEQAMARYGELGLALDVARTQLDLGALLRRRRRRADARRLLEAAAATGEHLGCPPLAARSREELSRLGGRRAAAGLTDTEARVATLVASGMSNADVAEALVVSTRSVEAHLTRIYAKLGIRSRTQLARRMLASEAAPVTRGPAAQGGRSAERL